MTEQPIEMSLRPPETVLPDAPVGVVEALEQAAGDRKALAEIAAGDPTNSEAWARLAEVARDDVEAYAYARTGYHRGLDALRRAGWRGTGYVRWSEPTNRGFLRALEALRRSAEAIGETDEAERTAQFLRQCDPSWNGLPS